MPSQVPLVTVVQTASEIELHLIENNAPLVTFRTQIDGADIDLTGKTIELYLKDDVTKTDADASTKKYSTADATRVITIQTPQSDTSKKGRADVQFLAADLGTAGKKRFHYDVLTGTLRVTHAHGTIVIENV